MAEVPEVAVAAVDRLDGGRDRHVVLGGSTSSASSRLRMCHSRQGAMIFSFGLSAMTVSSKRTWSLPLPVAPCATASAPSSSAISTMLLGDQRPGEAGAQQVLALVDRAGHHRRVDVVGDELLAQIFDVELAGAGRQRLRLQPGQLLFLAQVGAEADHLAAVVLDEPRHDARGVQPARVGEHDFVDGLLAADMGNSLVDW